MIPSDSAFHLEIELLEEPSDLRHGVGKVDPLPLLPHSGVELLFSFTAAPREGLDRHIVQFPAL